MRYDDLTPSELLNIWRQIQEWGASGILAEDSFVRHEARRMAAALKIDASTCLRHVRADMIEEMARRWALIEESRKGA